MYTKCKENRFFFKKEGFLDENFPDPSQNPAGFGKAAARYAPYHRGGPQAPAPGDEPSSPFLQG
jgi:hypothetical protein